MAKKKAVAATAKREAFSGHIPKLMAYLPSGNVAPFVEERYTGNAWVEFGKRNLFPQMMRTLVDNCAPLERCITTAAMLIAGQGVKFYDKNGEEIEEAVAVFDELMEGTTQEEFLFASAYDIAFLNARSWVVRRAAGADIVRLDHMDVSRLRADKMVEGVVPGYWYSSNWVRYRQGKQYEPEPIVAYGGDVRDARELMYTKAYKQGRDIYGEPWWLGAIKAAEVWAKVDKYNETQIDTGFSASVHLHTFTNRDDEELAKYDDRVTKAYTGSMGRGIFHTYGTPEEGAPQITPLQRGDHAGELDDIADRCERVIANAYGMPLALMGIEVKTGMDGASAALEQAYKQVMQMLILPKQQMITRDLVKLMNDKGLTDVWEARIDQLDLIADGLDARARGEAYLRSVSVNEYREKELDMEPMEDETLGNMPLKAPKEQSSQRT